MSDRNVNHKVTYVNYIYIYIYICIFNSAFTFDNILHAIQASDAR